MLLRWLDVRVRREEEDRGRGEHERRALSAAHRHGAEVGGECWTAAVTARGARRIYTSMIAVELLPRINMIMSMCYSMFSAGTETTARTTEWAIMFLLLISGMVRAGRDGRVHGDLPPGHPRRRAAARLPPVHPRGDPPPVSSRAGVPLLVPHRTSPPRTARWSVLEDLWHFLLRMHILYRAYYHIYEYTTMVNE
ncbi:unnamed protein product [Urochloa humidicola]